MHFLFILGIIAISLNSSASDASSEGLSKATIKGVMSASQKRLRECYEVESAKIPGLAGKFRVEIRVGKSGKVESTEVKDSTFAQPAVEDCVEAKIKKLTFIAPLEGQPTTFSYPFKFGNVQANKAVPQPPIGTPQSSQDSQVYKGHVFKKSNRPIEDPKILQGMARNPAIKAKADNCENLRVLKERCEDLEDEDRVVCSGMIESPPRKPSTPDWAMIVHPDAFRIVSGVYFLGYWHVACEHVQDL